MELDGHNKCGLNLVAHVTICLHYAIAILSHSLHFLKREWLQIVPGNMEGDLVMSVAGEHSPACKVQAQNTSHLAQSFSSSP